MHKAPNPFWSKLTKLATTALIFGLALTLLAGLSPNFNTQFVAVGEKLWPGYAQDLRK